MAKKNSMGDLVEVVVDTDAINLYLKGETEKLPANFPEGFRILISFTTLTELLLWLKLIDEELLSLEEKRDLKDKLEEFLAEVEVIHSNEEMCLEASALAFKLKQNSANFRHRWNDLFTAATARVLGLPVLTLNEKHFKGLVKIFKW